MAMGRTCEDPMDLHDHSDDLLTSYCYCPLLDLMVDPHGYKHHQRIPHMHFHQWMLSLHYTKGREHAYILISSGVVLKEHVGVATPVVVKSPVWIFHLVSTI